jgi:hypothetical protein
VELTERTNRRHHSQGLAIRPCLHILGHLKKLSLQEFRSRHSSLSNLKTTKHVSASISQSLSLFYRTARGKPLPILTNELDETEHDLLALEDRSLTPFFESSLGAVDRCCHFGIGVLGDSCDDVVGSWVVEIDIAFCAGVQELVVDKVGGVDGLNLVVVAWIAGGRRA